MGSRENLPQGTTCSTPLLRLQDEYTVMKNEINSISC